MTPHGKIHKMHAALSFHRLRESTCAKNFNCLFIDGKSNLVDVLTKHWSHNNAWPALKPILFWTGDAAEFLNNNSLSFEDGGEKSVVGVCFMISSVFGIYMLHASMILRASMLNFLTISSLLCKCAGLIVDLPSAFSSLSHNDVRRVSYYLK